VNLRHKSHCIFNQQYSKEGYFDFLGSICLSSFVERRAWKKKAEQYFKENPLPHALIMNSQNARGSYIFNSKNILDSFLIKNSEDCRYCFNLDEICTDCYDYSGFGRNAELVLEASRCGINISSVAFSFYLMCDCESIYYSGFCRNCRNCFGCIGLYNKEFCILNRQYTKDLYYSLVPKIVKKMSEAGEWGQFFPASLSYFPYNISHAQRYFPLGREQAMASGLHWHEKSEKQSIITDIPDGLPSEDSPISAKSTKSQNLFRITSEEIKKLRLLNAPLPRTSYDERMDERMKLLGSPVLSTSTCSRSKAQVITPFANNANGLLWDKSLYDAEYD